MEAFDASREGAGTAMMVREHSSFERRNSATYSCRLSF